MPMLRINIETTNAAIQIQTTPAKLQIASPTPDMNLHVQQVAVQLSSESPKVEIDQKQAFAESGLSSPLANAREFYKRALSNGIRAIGTIVNEGMQFLRIENGGNPVASQAKQTSAITAPKSVNVKLAPVSGAQVTVRPGKIEAEITEGQITNNFKPSEPKIEYNPYDIDIKMVPPPTIQITVDEVASGYVPMPIVGGRSVNAQL